MWSPKLITRRPTCHQVLGFVVQEQADREAAVDHRLSGGLQKDPLPSLAPPREQQQSTVLSGSRGCNTGAAKELAHNPRQSLEAIDPPPKRETRIRVKFWRDLRNGKGAWPPDNDHMILRRLKLHGQNAPKTASPRHCVKIVLLGGT